MKKNSHSFFLENGNEPELQQDRGFVATQFRMCPLCELTLKRNFCGVFLSGCWPTFHQLYAEHFGGRLIPQTLARRGVEAVANRLQISICERRGIGLAGQIVTQAVVRVLDSSFLLRRLRSQNQGSTPSPALRCFQAVNSVPRSKVIERRALAGRGDKLSIRLSITGFD